MSPVYLALSLVVYKENELSKPETCDFSTLDTTRERAKETGDM
jgi:hypothetical protein